MAVTSTFSAELISVSSILTYDVYKTYINPQASGKKLIWISYAGVFFFALALAAFSTGLYYVGISMGYLYLMMGVIISAAVLPATLTLLWSGQSWAAATFSPILGFACSLTGWLIKAKTEFGHLSVEATGSNMPMLVGNCVSLLSPLVFIAFFTYCPPFKPQNYDWQSMMDIKQSDDADDVRDEELEQRQLLRARKIARFLVAFLVLAFLLLWPIPMYGTGYIFSKKVSCRSLSEFLPLTTACSSSPAGSSLVFYGCSAPFSWLASFPSGRAELASREFLGMYMTTSLIT
jgi:hypothetical protein